MLVPVKIVRAVYTCAQRNFRAESLAGNFTVNEMKSIKTLMFQCQWAVKIRLSSEETAHHTGVYPFEVI